VADLTPEALAAELEAEAATHRADADRASLHDNIVALNYAAGRSDGLIRAAALVSAKLAPAHAALTAERDAARDDLADAHARQNDRWPRCPDGCGCRMDGEDSDARDCGCDGPCTMECRENGYPDAPSYRDLAVRHVMDDLAEANGIIADLREDAAQLHPRLDRYRAALEAALTILTDRSLTAASRRNQAEAAVRKGLEAS
jgi:hypothetical protein